MSSKPYRPDGGRHHVVIIGSGFGGIFAATELADADVDVTIIDRTNHHLFQPLLYQVATGLLSSGEIAPATRQMLSGQENATVLKGEVVGIDVSEKVVTANLGDYSKEISYDSLIVAAGASQSYFGNDHFAQFAPGMKSIDDALEIRSRIIGAFERAEMCDDPAEQERLLTFVVVGAGPTGVELAGQLAEMAHRTLRGSYRRINPDNAKIILLDGAPQVLPPFGKRLGRNAQRELEKIGVTVKLNALVSNVDETSVTYKTPGDDTEHKIESFCKIWSAGVAASPLGKLVAEQLNVEVDRAGRVAVNEDCSVGEDKNVFIVGDMMALNGLPGVAQVAIQTGSYVAANIKAEAEGRDVSERVAFEYKDKGSMATISRFSAVVKIGKWELTGFLGWVLWMAVHATFLIGFRNKATAAFNWFINAFSRKRWNMATTRQQMHARNALHKLKDVYGDDDDLPIELRDTQRFSN